MAKISNYISNLKKSLVSYISEQSFKNKFLITSQFSKIKSTDLNPVISICFDKILISPMTIDNYLENKPDKQKIDINFSILIYVPLKFGSNLCYDIFTELSDVLLNNNINISFNFISCSNIEFLKSINCFSLNMNSVISDII